MNKILLIISIFLNGEYNCGIYNYTYEKKLECYSISNGEMSGIICSNNGCLVVKYQ